MAAQQRQSRGRGMHVPSHLCLACTNRTQHSSKPVNEKPLLCLQVLTQPVYMEDHLGVLEEEVSAGLVPLPQLPKHKQVNLGP